MPIGSADSPPITAQELSSAFLTFGSLKHGEVLNVAITEQIQTLISNLYFLEVVFAPGSYPKLPTHLVMKWAIEEAEGPDPEVVFYRDLASALPSPPVVQCLATAPLTDEQRWIVIEDLRTSHLNLPWPHCPSDAQLHNAVAALARLHSQWWESPTVGSLHSESALRTMVHGVRDHLPAFFNDLGAEFGQADRDVLNTVFNSSLQPWFRLLDQRALAVIHGDAHPWNFLFPRSGQEIPFLIDWQLWHLDVGARDLAYMIGLHLDHDARKRVELPLLHFYHQQLLSAGIRGYSFDELLLDYRRCLVRNLTIPILNWSRGFPRDVWRPRLDRALAAYRDLAGAELL